MLPGVRSWFARVLHFKLILYTSGLLERYIPVYIHGWFLVRDMLLLLDAWFPSYFTDKICTSVLLGLLQVQDTLQFCGGPHKESEAVTEAPHGDLMLWWITDTWGSHWGLVLVDVVQLRINYNEPQIRQLSVFYITCQTCKLIFIFILKHSDVQIWLNCQC